MDSFRIISNTKNLKQSLIKSWLLILVFTIFSVFVSPSLALVINTDKIDYIVNDTIVIDGLVDSTTNNVTVTVNIYNSTGDLMNSSTAISSGGTKNYFSVSNLINANYVPGEYNISVNDGVETITLNFNVVSEMLFFKSHLIGNTDVKIVDTTTSTNESIEGQNNFSEIVRLSKSGWLHYGNVTNLTGNGKNYSFVLVDQNFNRSYDTVYIDDAVPYSEIWKIRKTGEKISTDVDYIIAEIEFSTGNKIILVPPINDSVYSSNQTVNFVGLIENSTSFKPNESLNITLKDSGGNTINSSTGETNENGSIVSNFTAPNEPGTYYIYINGTPVDVFSVETFKLFGKITDLTGTPTYSFSENPKIKLAATVKTTDGTSVADATVSANLTYPNGTVVNTGVLSWINNTNEYLTEISSFLEVASEGDYKVKIIATYSGDTQEFLMSFAIESVKLDVMAINPQFMEEAEGPEAMVDAFAPGNGSSEGSRVSLMVMLSDVSSEGLMKGGPEEMGLKDIEDENGTCSERVSLVSLKDENGNEIDTSGLNVSIMNLSSAVTLLAGEDDEGPEDEMLSQCMIIFNAPEKTGIYKAKVKLKHPLGEKESGTSFGIQRLYATANPVDFKGDDFWFYAPNSTIRIKLKITDLSSREEVPSGDITEANIIEMYKVWPTFTDVLDENYNPNATAENGTITFISPNSEGFFMFKFKFKVNLSGVENPGTGTGFFMLKKYMIWGEPTGCQPGQPCIKGVDENVTLTIHVVDIDKGSQMDLGQSGLTCSDKDNDGLPDCDGLEVDVEELWNDQLMKRMEEGTNYNVSKGVVRSSAANLTIIPIDLPTGWYHVDLVLTDKLTNDTYFGWAHFEVRNFWVDVMPITVKDDGNLSADWGMGDTYGVGQNILFTAMAFDPKNKSEWGPKILEISNISLESINLMRKGPPISLEEGVDYTCETSEEEVLLDWGPEGQVKTLTVINLTLFKNKTGEYQANVRVITTNKGSDIGNYWFQISSFQIEMFYRGMREWPVVFSPDEVVEVNISAYDFDDEPVILNSSKTKIRSFWNEKTGHPVRVNSSVTNTTCNGNNCTLTVNLSAALGGRPGKYDMEIEIVDVDGNKKQDGIFFETRGVIVSIPNIKEVWVDHQSDTNKRELDVENEGDRCDNDKGLNIGGGDCHFNDSTNVTYCFGQVNITTSSIYKVTAAGVYCTVNGEWLGGLCPSGEGIAIASNSTNLVYGSCNSSAVCNLTNNLIVNSIFAWDNINWTVVSIGNCSAGDCNFRVKNADGICGEMEICTDGGCDETNYILTPPNNSENFTTVYHGYVRNLVGNLECGDCFANQFPAFNNSRPVYIYHNTTYVWMSNSTNLSSVNGYAINELLTDSYAGIWNVSSINRNKVILRGQNILADTGAFVDTSLSKSGVIKIAAINERELGSWDKNQEMEVGVDLDGDGEETSTIYFAIADNGTSGVYDTFFYSNDSNFSNPISINGNRTERIFGDGANLTLLSILPDAKKVMVYGNKLGDWGDLGELKIGTNIKVPVVVRKPSGEDATANVSVKLIRTNSGEEELQVSISENITGIGELVINLSKALNETAEGGRYSFGLAAKTEGNPEEIMEEWKWPFITMRAFLIDSYIGEGGYISGFKQLPLASYRGEDYGNIEDIETINETGTEILGVFVHADEDTECSTITPPAGFDTTNFSVRKSGRLDNWRFGIANGTTLSIYIDRDTNCNFTDTNTSGPYNISDQVNLIHRGKIYILKVLEINWTNNRTSIGISDINISQIKPIKYETWGGNNPSPWWRLMVMNLSGTYYDIIFANGTVDYPMCSVWNCDECAKVAWFDTDGNFSDAIEVSIGQNFTSDLYLASIGPGPWEGIIIGNFSELSKKPNVGLRVQSNITWFKEVNESEVNLDLNRDGAKNETFYILAYDDRGDGEINRLIVDDDLNITEEWWGLNDVYYDFYGNETGIKEYGGDLPNTIWSGNLRFGEETDNMTDNERPNWEIETFNNTTMLIRKCRDTWRSPYNISENVTLVLKAYNFDQTPVSGANVSVERIMSFGMFGGGELDNTNYTVSIINNNQTDDDGYVIVTISPTGNWDNGEYMVQIKIGEDSAEIKTMWFRVDNVGGGGGS